jgi:hypothetical protein
VRRGVHFDGFGTRGLGPAVAPIEAEAIVIGHDELGVVARPLEVRCPAEHAAVEVVGTVDVGDCKDDVHRPLILPSRKTSVYEVRG